MLASAPDGATVTRHTYALTLRIAVLALVPGVGSQASAAGSKQGKSAGRELIRGMIETKRRAEILRAAFCMGDSAAGTAVMYMNTSTMAEAWG
jgi:hypothetical protein